MRGIRAAKPGRELTFVIAPVRAFLQPLAKGLGEIPPIELAVGDQIRIKGPRNAFPFVAAGSALFVAGGIGITAIWLMPFLTSPGRDAGYDIAEDCAREQGLKLPMVQA